MRYTVLWSPDAESSLARLWLAARDRWRLTEATRRMDENIAADAPNAGESRIGNVRILFELPLAALYLYNETSRTAVVLQVWRPKKS